MSLSPETLAALMTGGLGAAYAGVHEAGHDESTPTSILLHALGAGALGAAGGYAGAAHGRKAGFQRGFVRGNQHGLQDALRGMAGG